MRLALIGVPYASSGSTGGEALAPDALRAAGLVVALRQAGDVVDYGNVSFAAPASDRDLATGIIAPESLAGMVLAVRDAVRRACTEDRLPVVVGGECPLLLGCLAAAKDTYGEVGLLFLDGHEDAWPPHMSTTGEAADMELGFALGLTRPQGIAALANLLPLVNAEHAVVLGPRDRKELAAAGCPSVAPLVTFRDDETLYGRDLAAMVAAEAPRLAGGSGRRWFHLDLDVLASDALPAVRYPQPGGLDWLEAEAITGAALRTPGLVGWNITIYNPDLDPDASGARRIVAFLETVVARMAP
jgi:arginase